MIDAIKADRDTKARLTINEDVAHESWVRAFKEPDLCDWLLSHSK
jgi:hypothetical protein